MILILFTINNRFIYQEQPNSHWLFFNPQKLANHFNGFFTLHLCFSYNYINYNFNFVMTSCNPQTTKDHCNLIPGFLDITNQIELSSIIVLETLAIVIMLHMAWKVCKDKIWMKMEGAEKKIVIGILSALLTAVTIYIIANIMQIRLYWDIYYNRKTLNDINLFKNVYLVFAEMVPLIISNIYLVLCVLWEKILRRCLISSSKLTYVWIGIAAFFYNSGMIGNYIFDVIVATNPNSTDDSLALNLVVPGVFSVMTLAPAILIVVYFHRLISKLSYVDKRISSQRGFKCKIISLFVVNCFRIIYTLFILITLHWRDSILSLLKFQLNQNTNCCQRKYMLGFSIFNFGFSAVMTLLPIIVVFKIFDQKSDPPTRDDRQSILSQHSTSQQS